MNSWIVHFHLQVVSVITEPLEIDVPAQGNLFRRHSEWFENLPEDIQSVSNLWINWFYEKSLPDSISWRSMTWMMDLAEVLGMPMVHTTPRRRLFCSGGLDPRIDNDRPSTSSQGHVPAGTIWNWNSSKIHEEWRIHLVDCSFQRNEQTCGRSSQRKRRMCLSRRDGHWFRHRKPVATKTQKGQSSPQSQILSPRCSYQLTNGSGMTCVPSITSSKDPCHGVSRTSWEICYDIMVLIEMITGRLIGILCYIFYAAISKKEDVGKWSSK